MKVALEDFHGELGPLLVHSWDRTSIKDSGFRIARACLDGVGGVVSARM